MPRRFWTDIELQLLRDNFADSLTADLAKALDRKPSTVLQKAHALGLKKSKAIKTEMGRRAMADPNHGGRRTQLKPGDEPWNKGTHYVAGGRSAETRFKPGTRPHTWVPIGSYRIVEGYLQRKINDLPGPNTVRWRCVHELVWIEAHGPAPAGSVVVFKPGRKTTIPEQITLDAVELLTRRELMLRNSVHRDGPEIASIHQLRGQIRRQVNKRAKLAQENPHE